MCQEALIRVQVGRQEPPLVRSAGCDPALLTRGGCGLRLRLEYLPTQGAEGNTPGGAECCGMILEARPLEVLHRGGLVADLRRLLFADGVAEERQSAMRLPEGAEPAAQVVPRLREVPCALQWR